MKKILSLAVVCCLALVGIVFSSCEKEHGAAGCSRAGPGAVYAVRTEWSAYHQ